MPRPLLFGVQLCTIQPVITWRRNFAVMKIRIAPSILAADFARLGEQVRDAETAGGEIIHVDVMDGSFVPNITLGPVVIEAVRRSTSLPLDAHLMIVEPEHHIEAVASAGATRINVHWEASPNLHRTLQMIRDAGCGVGVALNPHTPASFLSEVIHMLDGVIVMTVNPGFGGQTFLPEMLPKIKQLRSMITASGRQIDLEVDGGINEDTVKLAVDAGADVLIAGTTIFSDKHSIQEGIDRLRQKLAQ
jgi:ribulose-phosphate 3-epimerase